MPQSELWLGIDMGSTTVKSVVMNPETKEIIHSEYRRHDGSPLPTLTGLLSELADKWPDTKFRASFTGSQASEYALWLDMPYIQEVIAGSIAVAHLFPTTRTSVELGGQDAKILFFNPEEQNGVSDMRMNGVCAGGTGAFLDQIAALLHIPIEEFNEYASRGTTLYDISGRCGVFAKTDIQPLMNQGVPKEDIALSCYHALAKQTIGGLAQGMEIHKPVLFAGGPFFFMPKLIDVFTERLELGEGDYQFPENAQTFIALGTALALDTALGRGKGTPSLLKELADQLVERSETRSVSTITTGGTPFFASPEEKTEFLEKYAMPEFVPAEFEPGEIVDCWIGIDGGSTTTKFVMIDDEGTVLYKFYQSNRGEPIDTARAGLLAMNTHVEKFGATLNVKGLGTTGYGEHLFAKAFGADFHTVETIAHKEAAAFYEPEVSFILDLGGQDMKAIFVRDGVITDIVLNEACSAGCGSFIESYSSSLKIAPQEIAGLAFESGNPSVLGSRCTVFMNSSIISEQKSGKSVGDILGGLCSSVIENLFTKVVRIPNPDALGSHIVVQGGTFKNDAVLRAFVQYVGRDVIRPEFAGEMGALGIALLTKSKASLWEESRFIGFEALEKLSYSANEGDRCPFCANACARSIIQFSNGTHFITGNRCERGEVIGDAPKVIEKKTPVPNMMRERETALLHNYNKEFPPVASKGKIGIPLVLDFYDSLPFWNSFFAILGYEVVYSGRTTAALFESGLKHIPSDTVCLPAKVVHGHFKKLIDKGVSRIFFPTVMKNIREHDQMVDSWNCAVLQGYPEIIRISEFSHPEYKNIELLAPAFKWTSEKLRKNQIVDFAKSLGEKASDAEKAFAKADEIMAAFKQKLLRRGEEVLAHIKSSGTFGIVLAGRPYHGDSFINHGVADLFTSKGIPVLVNENLPLETIKLPETRIDLLNPFHTRMIGAAEFVALEPSLELVQLVSFGCGHDAVLTDEVDRILRDRSGKGILSLKLDEGENKGPLNIRITSFVETIKTRRESVKPQELKESIAYERKFGDDDMKKDLLVPNLKLSFSYLMARCFETLGYNAITIPMADRTAIDYGKKYVHNDICFPAQVNVGEHLGWLHANPDRVKNTAVMLAKNCNDCRAGHYAALARKALDANGFEDVPILTTDFNDKLNMHPSFKIHEGKFSIFMIRGIALIDAIDDMLFKCRPYEKVVGATEALHIKVLEKVVDTLAEKGWKAALAALEWGIEQFNNLETIRTTRRPRVGIIGEILVNFHDAGNYNIVDYLEQNGMEVVLPALIEFWRQDVVNFEIMADRGHTRAGEFKRFHGKAYDVVLGYLINQVEKRMKSFKYYEPHSDIKEIGKNAASVMDIAYRTGEGWLIPGEIISWIGHGIDSFLIVQPFGCLPNHITGRGVTKAIKDKHPHVTILSLDFDPDTSLANIHNRMQMVILNATSKEAELV